MRMPRIALFCAACLFLLTAFLDGTSGDVPGYDVIPVMGQSNTSSSKDYDYVWDSDDHSGTGAYTPGIDSNWNPKLFQWGWTVNPGVIMTCKASPCQMEMAGISNLDPQVGFAHAFA